VVCTAQTTETNPSKKEKPLLSQPEPSITVVNTHLALCLFGVRTSKAIQIHTDAKTAVKLVKVCDELLQYVLLIGANQRIMRCSQLVGNEQIVPNKHSTNMARSTV
jgi:hypothetical protein